MNHNQTIDWTVERVETVTTMWAAGSSAAQIAAAIPNATRNAVIGKIKRLNLPRRANGHPSPVCGVRTPRAAAARAAKMTRAAPPERRNQPNSLAQKIAIAEAEPGLPPKYKGEQPDGSGIKFFKLDHSNCHWPKGDPLDENFEFCGERAIPGMPYCAHHCKISYMPAADRRRATPRA